VNSVRLREFITPCAHLLVGDPEKARELAIHGMKTTIEAEFSLGTGLAHRTMGRIARSAGDLVESKAHFAQAMTIFASIPAQFELARTHVDLATLASLQHDPNLARRHYESAARLFTRLLLNDHARQAKLLAGECGQMAPAPSTAQQTNQAN
jgi:hypothetical protein